MIFQPATVGSHTQIPSWSITARWIFPGDRAPLENGIITVAAESITAIAPRRQRTADVDLGDAAVLPGLVNAHTHLDLSGLRGAALPKTDFTQWLRRVIQFRRKRSLADVENDIRAGWAQSLACGTTLLGDISAGGLSWTALAAAPLRAVIFYEVLGLPRMRARLAWKQACDWLDHHPPAGSLRPGLSPHAPYSVRRSLFRAAARRARRDDLPLAVHLAETRHEIALLRDRAGPFPDFLREMQVYDPEGLVHDPQEALRLHRGLRSFLIVHGNYLDDSRLPKGGTVVYCPRTHAAFAHEPHPFPKLLAAGVRVALGTDSLASNPDLNLLEEARFLHHKYPQLPGETLLRMATLSGAEALGWEHETGSLTPGKSADLVVVPLAGADGGDPHHLFLESREAVNRVLFRGRWVHGSP
jgi:cytosine/adenosine deaminase-related metal-dependent hydrolase